MKLLLDEDSQGHLLVRLLRTDGHEIETVNEAGLTSQDDPTVLAHAKRTGRVLLTRNGRDFLRLHQADHQHPGILIEHQDADPAKNMTYPQIAAAIGKIETSGWNFQGQIISINAWQ
jgi:predicted nuclease of predicted toxin-antitoxin system